MTLFEKSNLQFQVFRTLIDLASNGGRVGVPARENALVLGIAGGLIDYLGGKSDSVPPFSSTVGTKYNWQEPLNYLVDRMIKSNPEKLVPEIAEAIRDLIHIKWTSDLAGESGYISKVAYWLVSLEPYTLKRTTLTYKSSMGYSQPIAIFPGALEQLAAIAEKMRPFFKRDLELIRDY